MKVLIIHPQMKFYGGAELLIVELCNWLSRKGIKNDILTLCKSSDIEKALKNTQLIVPKNHIGISSKGFESTAGLLKGIFVLRKSALKIAREYDVVNYHNYPATWTLWPVKKPSVWMLNEPPNLWSRPDAGLVLKTLNKARILLDRLIVRASVDVICVADEFNKKRCLERYGRNSEIVYYGVNHEFFSRGNAGKAVKKWKLKNRFVVIQSGVLSEQKNQLASLNAINNLKNKIPNVLLVLAGKSEGDYEKLLKDYAKKNGIERQVLFTGNLSREELRDLYKAGDVGLFPVGKQGGWLAPFEMLCSGKPIIASKELGASSIIKKFNLGIITEDYSKAILGVYGNKGKCKKQAEKASKFIKTNLGWDIFSDKMINAYKKAVSLSR